jgi:AraC-like DNA-binding protein
MTDHVQYHRVLDTPGLVLSEARFSHFQFDPHYHLDFHIGLVTQGAQRQHCRGDTVLLTPGRIALMPPGEIHDGGAPGGHAYTLQTFRLSPALLRGLTEELAGCSREPCLAASVLDDGPLASDLLRVHTAMQSSAQALPLSVQSQWLLLLARVFERTGGFAPQPVAGALAPLQRRRIEDYCRARLSEKITLDQLAALCGLGRFQFLRGFKHTVGVTPHAWLLRLRLEQACALLNTGALSIAQVAHEVGFYDQSHFNRAFRHAFGVAPSRY